jgi:hypothetical protein
MMMPRRWLIACGLALAAAGCSGLVGLDKNYQEQDCFPTGSCAEAGPTEAGTDAGPDGLAPPDAAREASAVVDTGAGDHAVSESGSPDAGGPPEAGVVAAQLSVKSTALDFGTLTVGQSVAPGTIDVGNDGNATSAALTTALTGAAFSVVSDGCKGTALAPAGVCHIQIALDDSAAGTPAGTFSITDTASDAVTVKLAADILAPGTLAIAPQSEDFKSCAVGAESPAQVFTVTNTGMTASGVLSVALNPTNGTLASEFPITDGCSGHPLAANDTCTVSVLLAPATSGPKSASLVVNASPGGPTTASLIGAGMAPALLTVSPTPFPFPTTAVGTASTAQTFTVTNAGDVASAAITAALAVGAGTASTEFAVTTNTCTGVMLAGGTSCAIDVAFKPATYGTKSASLNINGGPPTATMTGTGQDSLLLTVAKAGAGSGTVTDAAGSIDCGTTCSAQYARTTSDPVVVLTATPDATSTFAGWTGASCTGTGTCTVTLSAATTVTAQFNVMQKTLTVDLRALGGTLAGTITSNPAGISCSATGGLCTTTASFNVGSTVKLTVGGAASTALRAWLPTSCTGSTCSVVMNSSQTVIYTATANNIVFATSSTYTGDLGGLAGATTDCANAASIAGLPGTYVPWLATSTVNATAALGSARGWIRMDGLPFADTVGTVGAATGLVNGQVYYPVGFNELGNVQPGFAWTGATWTGAVDNGYSCSDWTSGATDGSAGDTSRGSDGWTNAQAVYCGNLYSLYCFGTNLSTPVTITPQTGRHAFVSKGAFTTTGGLLGADTLCKNEATSAALPNAGNFLAFMASSGASAASRFNLAGANWVRIDGLPVASSITNLLAGQLLAPPTVHADGTYVIAPDFVWTGAPDPSTAGTMATTCNNWTSNASGVGGEYGLASATSGSWFGFSSTFACASVFTDSAYCFEN